MRRERFVAGIDVGTTKICTVIGLPTDRGALDVVGVGTYASHGLKRGIVVDRQDATEAIRLSVAAAERMADITVKGAYVGITGDHIQCQNVTGRVRTGQTGEVKPQDVEKVVQSARDSVSLPSDRQVIHTIVRDFILDGEAGVKRPEGMTATYLDAEVHVVNGMHNLIENVAKCVTDCGIEVQKHILEPIATNLAVITDAERDLGVILVDIGGGTTDIAAFVNGAICHSSSLPVASNHITRDIARVVHIGTDDAEKLKCRFGRALADPNAPDDYLQVPVAGAEDTKRVPQKLISQIIQPRVEEIFTMVRSDLRRAGVYRGISGGLVISGGGSQLPDMWRLASEVLDGLPVRVGTPRNLVGLAESVSTPIHATGVGLAILAAREGAEAAAEPEPEASPIGAAARFATGVWDGLTQKVAELLRRPSAPWH